MSEISIKIFQILKELWDFDQYVLDFENVTEFKNFERDVRDLYRYVLDFDPAVQDLSQNVGDFNLNV